jgi:hypothetical protein
VLTLFQIMHTVCLGTHPTLCTAKLESTSPGGKTKRLSLLTLHICGVSKKFGEWYQKTNKTEDTNKLTFVVFILHNTRLATFIKLLETVSKGLFRNRSQNCCSAIDY